MLPIVVNVCAAFASELHREGVRFGATMLSLSICQFLLIFLFSPLE